MPVKATINRVKGQATDQEKIFANQVSEKAMIHPEYIKKS